MRTFTRTEFDEAGQQWAAGEFSPEWKPYRHAAAMRGLIKPPEGTKWDSWDDEEPSQRAMLVRAMRETPKLMAEAVARARAPRANWAPTWSDVLTYILARRDEWRAEMAERERDAIRRRAEEEPDHKESAMAIKSILTRIGDS